MTAEAEDPGLYPLKWSEFVGQDTAKEQIKLAAQSARKRRKPAEHILLAHSDPGVGKTALAKLAAMEMHTPLLEISGMVPMHTARRIFASVKPRTTILWDEFHRSVEGGKKNAEWTLHALQDQVLPGPFGPEPLPPFTMIAATTDVHRLPSAIVGRFMRPHLVEYTHAEAARITLVMAKKILLVEGLPLPSKDNARSIAGAANQNPRAIGRLLKTLRDIAVVTPKVWDGTTYDLKHLLRLTGTTVDGLDGTAQEYLKVLLREFPEGAGLRTLEDRLQEPTLSETERLLVTKGYIGKTRSGRTLTAAGIARAESLLAAA